MAYSFQTFSIGQILTAAQMNQVEASIRDHVHGTAGVSAMNLTGHITSTGLATVLGSFTSAQLLAALTDETGTGLAVFSTSPVFTTQISTPKIISASGDLDLAPSSGITTTTRIKSTVSSGANAILINTAGAALEFNDGTIANAHIAAANNNNLQFYTNTATDSGLVMHMILDYAGAFSLGATASEFTVSPGGNVATATQISTPKVVTASGVLLVVPASNANVVIGNGTTGNNQFLIVNGGSATSKGAGIELQQAGAGFFNLFNEAALIGSGSSATPCLRAMGGVGLKFMVNAHTTVDVGIDTSGNFYVGPTGEFAVSPAGKVTAGNVPLARMMSYEEFKTGTAAISFTLVGVEVGDKIFLTGSLSSSSTATSLKWDKASGTAACSFGGNTALIQSGVDTELVCSGICSIVTTPGNIVLRLTPAGAGTLNTYGHIMILQGV